MRLQSVCLSIGSGHPGHAYHSKHLASSNLSLRPNNYLLHIVTIIIVVFHYCQVLKSSMSSRTLKFYSIS